MRKSRIPGEVNRHYLSPDVSWREQAYPSTLCGTTATLRPTRSLSTQAHKDKSMSAQFEAPNTINSSRPYTRKDDTVCPDKKAQRLIIVRVMIS